MMNLKGRVWKRWWPNFNVGYYPGIHLKGLRRTTAYLRIAGLRA
jgi:hypothetical protein